MTALGTDIRLTEGRNATRSGQPIWLTGLAFALALAAHGTVVAALISYAPEVPLPPIAIDLVPSAEITADMAPAQEPQQAQEASQEAAQETPTETPQEAKTEPEPEPPEQQTAALPEPEPPAPVVPPTPEPAVTAPPVVRETPKPPSPKPVAKPKPRPEPKPEPKIAAKPKERPKAEARAEPPAAARSAARSSVAAGAASANRAAQSGMSSAAYASLVAAALNRLKAYPAAARQSGASGSVGVSFTIGPSGRVTNSSIRSSGNGLLDAAVRQMLASLQVPPPPSGTFRTGTTISFSLR